MLTLTPANNEALIKAEITEIRKETNDVKTFRLKPDVEMAFLPGQFIFIYVNINNERVKRAYSIASSPLDKGFLEITIKKEPHGKMSTYMNDIAEVGQKFTISRPMGKFNYTDDKKEITCIAGGSGVVPFRSMIRYCRQKNLDTKIILLYSTKEEKNIIYREELDEFNSEKTKIVYALTRDSNWTGHKGRIDSKLILGSVENPKDNIYFLCGPLEFIRSSVAILTSIGVDRANIKRDVWA